jgi:rhomboid protease GluP
MSRFYEKLSKALGLNYVWWHWRWLRFKQRLKASFSTDTNTARHLRSRQRICRCGALAGAGERTCGFCGAKLPSAAANFLSKVFGLILPGVSPVTAGLVSIIALNFIFQMVISRGGAFLKPNLEALLRAGALASPLVAAGQWWRLVTCVFVHIGVIHFVFNMYALVSVSHFLEQEIGSARYLVLFLLTGAGGSAASYAFHPNIVMAGASGALFGLIGFSISYFRRQGGARSRVIQSFMLRWAVYGFFFGLLMRADNIAHAGGFVTGFLLGAVMEFREDEKRKRALAWKLLASLLSFVFGLSFFLLFKYPYFVR